MAAGRLSRRTSAALAGLALAVLTLHGLVLDEMAERLSAWREVRPMPPRLTAAFVRALQPATPPPVGRPPAAVPAVLPAPAPGAAPAAQAPSTPASAPEPSASAAVASAASAPAATVEPASAASAPLLPLVATASAASAVSAAAAASAPGDFQPGPEWPASTRLDYKLRGNYRGAVTGRARVEWLRDGRRYQVHLEVAVGPGFAPLIARTMSSEGVLTPQGIQPERFDEDTRVLLAARRRLTLQFLGPELVFPNGRREWAPAGVQDAASQFVQLTWLFLTGRETLAAGREVRLPLALPRKLYAWRYVIEGEETLETPMGPLAAWHLRPLVENTGSDLRAEVWLAPSLQYLPVRLMIRQDEQTWIDLMLQSAPLQAAP